MNSSPAVWHDDVTINGEPYPTRHIAADAFSKSSMYLSDLPDSTRDTLRATHEAAHAVAGLAGGAHIHYAKITTTAYLNARPFTHGIPGGDVFACHFRNGQSLAVYLGAGERAEDHWLRQAGLWTPARALGIELGAYMDRQTFLANNPHFGFGADHNDYLVVHDLADQLVTQHWDAITAVAEALVTDLYLTGDHIADLAKLPNGTHSAACTYAA